MIHEVLKNGICPWQECNHCVWSPGEKSLVLFEEKTTRFGWIPFDQYCDSSDDDNADDEHDDDDKHDDDDDDDDDDGYSSSFFFLFWMFVFVVVISN